MSKRSYEELEKEVWHLRTEVERLKDVEENLRQSEEKFRFIVENSIDAIWQTDLRNKVTFISPSTKNIGGYTPEEVMGLKNGLELYDHETQNAIMNAMSQYLQKPVQELKEVSIPPIEGRGHHKNGHLIWVEIQAKFVFQGDKMVGLQGVTRDISVRKETEIALQTNERLLKAVIESTEDGILAVDKDGQTIIANERFRRMWQIPKDLFETKNDTEMLQFAMDQLKKPDQFLTQVTKLYDSQDESFDILDFKDGRKFERFSSPMTRAEEPIGRVWSFRDITEKAKAEKKLRESENQFRTLVENLPVAVYQTTPGPDGRFLMANPAFLKIFGYENEMEVKRLKVSDLYEKPGERQIFSDALMEKGVIEIDERKLRTKDNTPVYASITANFTDENDEKEPHFDCILMDFTERKKLQNQLMQAQKMEALGRVAGGVAHDLNNILSGLVGYPELLLLQLPENSPLRKPIATIQKSGEKAAALVQDLLTLARRGVSANEVCNLNHILSDLVKSPEYEKFKEIHPGVHVAFHLSQEIFNVFGSPAHLHKTAMNLITNGAEAMPEGGKIVITTENRYLDEPLQGFEKIKEGEYVVLSVSDTGTGISPEDMGKIFEPFYTRKKMGRSGTGLGTTVVWGTVKDHGGYIDLKSAEGKGSTFTLYFPATRKAGAEEKPENELGSCRGNREFILVVDDVKSQREITCTMLGALNYNNDSVSSGEEALEYVKTRRVDLLILDMIMEPGMDGLDTYKQILQMNPQQKAILVSGFSETARVKEFQSLRSGGYLKKPFLLKKLGIAVKEELAK